MTTAMLPVIGRPAPDFSLPATTGETVSLKQFKGKKTVILGVSTDGIDSHRHFIEKHRLPFPLLADEDATVSKMYGVYKQKNLYGKKYMGIERTTFVIDRTGRVAQIYPKVKVEGHIQDLLEFVGDD